MYQRIVVTLDQSETSEHVLPYVRLLAKSLKSKVELVQVLDVSALERAYLTTAREFIERITSSGRQSVETYLEKTAAALRQEGIQASYSILEGNPAEAIVAHAAAQPSTLVAISTHGRSGPQRWMLGSVADKVVQTATTPLLVVRGREGIPPPKARFTNLVLPLDGSPEGEQVLPHAVALAKALSLPITLVRSTPTVAEYYRFIPGDVAMSVDLGDVPEQVDAEARHYLEQVQERLRQQGVSVSAQLMHGDPATAIIEAAGKAPGSLVAMSTHGRSGVRRWVLGSVTDRVVRHGDAPVLVVRAAPQGA